MRFPELGYLSLFLLGAALTAAVMPLWKKICARYELVDEPGSRKMHSGSIPLAGGLAIFSGILLALGMAGLLLAMHVADPMTVERIQYGFTHRGGQLAVIVCGGLAMLSLGLLDDRYELSPGIKFFGQVLVAFLVAASGIRITLFVPSIVFSYAVTILWIVTLVNAFNFMDNMNGLCGGLAAIAALLFACSAAFRGDYLVAGLSFLCAGSFCGFLPYNFPRATAFLGDSGSHLLGFIVAVLAVLPHYYSSKYPHPAAVLSPLLILAVPLFDLASVVIIRWRAAQPFYLGDNNHLSHRLVRRGFPPVRAVILIWLAALVIGAISFLF